VILIVAIIALVPRSAPIVAEHAHTVGELQHSFVYSIVLDAGSTGSRIHVFKFSKQGSSFNLISDEFKQTKPGLSAYKDDPKAAADSLKVLMDVAMATVPKEQQVRRRSKGSACCNDIIITEISLQPCT
jgi:Golgi nucleoside diphosphatase